MGILQWEPLPRSCLFVPTAIFSQIPTRLTRVTQVVFDTGSATLEFASRPIHQRTSIRFMFSVIGTLCNTCQDQIQFNPNQSSTFVDGGSQFTIVFGTGAGVTPVIVRDTFPVSVSAHLSIWNLGKQHSAHPS